METTATAYAISMSIIVISLAFVRALCYLAPLRRKIWVYSSKYLAHTYFLNRHRLLGPWTYGYVLLHILYWSLNVFCLFFRVSNSDIGRQAADLALVNMGFLFSTPHLSFLADILGVKLSISQAMHGSTAWMFLLLSAFHAITEILVYRNGFSAKNVDNLLLIIV